jgi:hypothetical protein
MVFGFYRLSYRRQSGFDTLRNKREQNGFLGSHNHSRNHLPRNPGGGSSLSVSNLWMGKLDGLHAGSRRRHRLAYPTSTSHVLLIQSLQKALESSARLPGYA